MRTLRTPRWLAAIALAACLAVAAAACGGVDEQKSSPGRDDAAAGQSRSSGTDTFDPGAAEGRQGVAPGEEAPPTGDGGNGGAPLASQLDRKIVRVATLSITTGEVSGRFEDIGNIAVQHGGYVASSTFGNDDEGQSASVTIKVPAAAYQDAVSQLRGLGDVRKESSNASDATEEYTDLSSRLRNLRATEAQYIEFLGRAQDIGSVLQVQDRLNATRLEIEQVQGRILLLENTSELATITVHLAPPVASTTKPAEDRLSNPLEAAEAAFAASLDVLLGFAVVALAIAAFSWWLVPLGVVVWVLARRTVWTQRHLAAPPPPPAPAP